MFKKLRCKHTYLAIGLESTGTWLVFHCSKCDKLMMGGMPTGRTCITDDGIAIGHERKIRKTYQEFECILGHRKMFEVIPNSGMAMTCYEYPCDECGREESKFHTVLS